MHHIGLSMGGRVKISILIVIVGLIGSCALSSPKQIIDIEQNVGWLHGNCLAIKEPNIEFPMDITLANLDSKQSFQTASITGEAQSSDECYALLDDRIETNIGSGYSFYKVKSNNPINMAIGFLQLDNPDQLVFDYCTTTEGILFSILKSDKKIWKGYYSLGYESEATCDEQSYN